MEKLTIQYWDFMLILKVMKLRRRMLNKIIRSISFSGDGYFYPLILILLPLQLNVQSILPFMETIFLAFIIELSLYKLIKKNVRRLRPFAGPLNIVNFTVPSDEFSFPSGHTAAAFVMLVFLSALNPIFFLPALAWALSVGFSRVYLGVHYPSDILAGMALGLVSAHAAILITGI